MEARDSGVEGGTLLLCRRGSRSDLLKELLFLPGLAAAASRPVVLVPGCCVVAMLFLVKVCVY